MLHRRVHPRPSNPVWRCPTTALRSSSLISLNRIQRDLLCNFRNRGRPICVSFEVLDRCGWNKSATQAMVNGDQSFDSGTPARTPGRKTTSFTTGCSLARARRMPNRAAAAAWVLVFLRKWVSPTARLPDVCPAVFIADDAMRDIETRRFCPRAHPVSRF
jgi:hypothetical protein